MKNLLILFIYGMIAASCTTPKNVKKEAARFGPVLNADAQVERAVGMIKEDEKLSIQQKKELINLVEHYSYDAVKIRQKQSQVRALLISELLKSVDGHQSMALSTAKELDKLSRQDIKLLDKFFREFNRITGELDQEHQRSIQQMAGRILNF